VQGAPLTTAPPYRQVTSFVHQRNRLTDGQRLAWARLWPVLGHDVAALLDRPETFDPPGWFGRRAALVLEIGPGDGESTVVQAAAAPQVDHLAVEVFEPGLARLLMRIEAAGLANLHLLRGDAVALLRRLVAPGSLAGVRIFFPDPWPKRRHHKRRLLQPGVAALLASRLAPGARLHLATDWDDYADQMRAVCDAQPLLSGGVVVRPVDRPVTKFERRALAEGRRVQDVIYRRTGPAGPSTILATGPEPVADTSTPDHGRGHGR